KRSCRRVTAQIRIRRGSPKSPEFLENTSECERSLPLAANARFAARRAWKWAKTTLPSAVSIGSMNSSTSSRTSAPQSACTNYRQGEDVYLYRVLTSQAQARERFLEYVHALNALRTHPRWYNAITTNCTTTVRLYSAQAFVRRSQTAATLTDR